MAKPQLTTPQKITPTKPPGPRVSGTGQVHMTIRLPAPIRNQLASQARREQRTMSAIVAEALTKLWEKE